MGTEDDAEVVAVDGRAQPLSRFLTTLLKGGDVGISEIARRANLSRSFLYLLMDDEQVPSVESLIALLEAAGCEEVRAADPGEPGDLAFRWRSEDLWVRLPATGKRAARSRQTLRSWNRTTNSSPSRSFAPPQLRLEQEGLFAGASYSMVAGSAEPTSVGDRQRLLGELLEAAGAMDEDRLRLLIEHARLLRRG